MRKQKFSSELQEHKDKIYNIIFWYGKKITHAYARYYNFGDNALAYGVKNIFSKYLFPDARYINEDVHTQIFDKKKIASINKMSSLFIIGGGGLIHTLSKKHWLLSIPNNSISSIKIPLILYGLGCNNFDDSGIDSDVLKNIRLLQKKAISFSVRNDESQERLKKQGLIFDEVPDPGFFVDGNHPAPKIDGKYIVLQIAYDSAKERQTAGNLFFNNIVKLCNHLLLLNYKIVLAPHCFPDIEISNKVVKHLNSSDVFLWNWFDFIREDMVSEGLGYYKHAEFVIAMRGHAQICPIGMGVPVISIINHPKHLGLLRKINSDNLSVNVNDSDFLSQIINLISYVIANNQNIRDKNKAIVSNLELATKEYIDIIAKRLRDFPPINLKLKNKLRYRFWKFIDEKFPDKELLQNNYKILYKIYSHLYKKLNKKGIV